MFVVLRWGLEMVTCDYLQHERHNWVLRDKEDNVVRMCDIDIKDDKI